MRSPLKSPTPALLYVFVRLDCADRTLCVGYGMVHNRTALHQQRYAFLSDMKMSVLAAFRLVDIRVYSLENVLTLGAADVYLAQPESEMDSFTTGPLSLLTMSVKSNTQVHTLHIPLVLIWQHTGPKSRLRKPP